MKYSLVLQGKVQENLSQIKVVYMQWFKQLSFAGAGEAVDSSTLRATGTFSNKGKYSSIGLDL